MKSVSKQGHLQPHCHLKARPLGSALCVWISRWNTVSRFWYITFPNRTVTEKFSFAHHTHVNFVSCIQFISGLGISNYWKWTWTILGIWLLLKRVVNTTHCAVLLTNLEVFGNEVKHYLECFIYLLNRNENKGVNGKIKPKHRYDHDFLCLNFVNY